MATTLILIGGSEVKVTADLEDIARFLREGAPGSFQRFAGFRGDQAVGAEPLIVRPEAVAYAMKVPTP
jgi:hypothetical protein